jgi:hypothetical protein
MQKYPRNQLCHCGSGLKYKYCHIAVDRQERILPVISDPNSGATISVDLTEDWMNMVSQLDIPLKNFCKDHDFYYFGLMTVGQSQVLREKLQNNTLTKSDFFEAYKITCVKESMLRFLDSCCDELEFIGKRKQILTDAFNAHFEGKYSLSIPTLFTQLEGIIRDYGNIPNRDNVKPVIPTDIWERKLLFHVKDDAMYYNGFIQKLFAGSGNADDFNRNPILHGFNIDYISEEHSLLLILSILEIRMFEWHDKNTEDYIDKLKSKYFRQ